MVFHLDLHFFRDGYGFFLTRMIKTSAADGRLNFCGRVLEYGDVNHEFMGVGWL